MIELSPPRTGACSRTPAVSSERNAPAGPIALFTLRASKFISRSEMGTFRPDRAWSWRMTLVLAFAAVLYFACLGQRALWSEEVRWAEIPREMQLSGNYLWPTINGQTYYDKPLGSYWLVLLAATVNGTVDEWAARVPSAVCGVLGVLLLMLLARRLYDETTAALAGVILATSFSFVFFSRHASADIENVTGILACLWLFQFNRRNPGGWWTLGLWLLMALTSLTKGLLGFAFPLLIAGAYSTLTPTDQEPASFVGKLLKRNRWLVNRNALLAVPLGLLVYLAPFLLSVDATGSADGLHMVYRENIRRFFDPVNHRGPIYLYLYVIFALMAPWSLFLPAALVHQHQEAPIETKLRDSRRFVLVFFWAVFGFFTLSSSRRSYYLLPIVPAGALLIARLLSCTTDRLSRSVGALLTIGWALFGVATVAGVILLVPPAWILSEPWRHLPPLPYRFVLAILWLSWVAGLAWAFSRRRAPATRIWFAWVSATGMATFFLVVLPGLEPYRTQKQFAAAVKQTLGAQTSAVALYRYREIVYYLNLPQSLAEYNTPEELARGINAGRLQWLILRRADLTALPDGCRVVSGEQVFPWETPQDIGRKLILVEIAQW
jgi:4-amino-4-deoxy-L-arabinose transferase-like glycosyltransferase